MTTDPRALRLQLTVKACAWWLAAQGVFLLVLGDRLASWLNLRWMPTMAPYLRLAGLSLLALALFVHRGVDQARRQYLAVDSLLLLMLGHSLLTLNQQRVGGDVTVVEWVIAGVDLALAVALLVLRTRSKNMHQAGALMVMDASTLVRQTGSWIAGTGPRPKADLGPLDPAEAAAEAAAQAPAAPRWADGSEPLMPAASPARNAPPAPKAEAPAPKRAASPLTDEELLAMNLPPEKARNAPLVQAAPLSSAAPLPPPTPTTEKTGRSEAVPRMD